MMFVTLIDKNIPMENIVTEPIKVSPSFGPEIRRIILRATRTGRINNRDLDELISYIHQLLHR